MLMRERQDGATGASRTTAPPANRPLDYRRGIIVATIAGLLMTFLGAFGTGSVPLGARLAFWLVVTETGALIGIGVSTGICAWGRLARQPLLEGAAISLVISLPLTLAVIGASLAFFGGHAPSASGLLATFGGVLVVTGAITAVNYARSRIGVAPTWAGLIATERDSPSGEPGHPTLPARAKLMDRLPRHLRDAELYAIQSEDHYLRIHTSAGADLILMRMTDVMLELDGIEGSRTHRSWWVARSAIRSVERREGRAELTLPGNIMAPVSRAYMQPLQARGWFV